MHSHSVFYIAFFLSGVAGLSFYSALYNPYARFHRVRNPFRTQRKEGRILLESRFTLRAHTSLPWRLLAYAICAAHIATNQRGGRRARGTTIESITAAIHATRFDPRKPYLISGDHFNVLYPRNLGVFYYPLLDARTALTNEDWLHRQEIYLQSTAYTLAAFQANGDCTTTIVPVGAREVACINIYQYPSDALYGVLFALHALQDPSLFDTMFPELPPAQHKLETIEASTKLVGAYRVTLEQLLEKYVTHVYNPKTGLVREDIYLSSAKDITKRQGAFYDNVILWRTLELADLLGIKRPLLNLSALKQKILSTYWDEMRGYFIEDNSPEARTAGYYSADWLCVVFTGFLNPHDPRERHYLTRSVAYTIAEKLDLPFPLRYQQEDRAWRQHLIVRVVVPSYGGTSIWSFWGVEFIKLLLVLHSYQPEAGWRARALTHLQTYDRNILASRGYPEVYDTSGIILQRPLYNSVRQTGWIVGHEQAYLLYKHSVHEKNNTLI